mmetsp:Transcript_40938/g.128905  ORF Transcript_40938/g.128905 Transcript_40938/m.128905 type:complete len:91 (-) Transcript_40938:784-1056(-)
MIPCSLSKNQSRRTSHQLTVDSIVTCDRHSCLVWIECCRKAWRSHMRNMQYFGASLQLCDLYLDLLVFDSARFPSRLSKPTLLQSTHTCL